MNKVYYHVSHLFDFRVFVVMASRVLTGRKDISALLESVLGSNIWTQYKNVITYVSNEKYNGLQFEIR